MISTIITLVGAVVGATLLISARVIDAGTRKQGHRLDVLNGRRWLLEKILDDSQFLPTHVAIEGGYRAQNTPSSNLPRPEGEQ